MWNKLIYLFAISLWSNLVKLNYCQQWTVNINKREWSLICELHSAVTVTTQLYFKTKYVSKLKVCIFLTATGTQEVTLSISVCLFVVILISLTLLKMPFYVISYLRRGRELDIYTRFSGSSYCSLGRLVHDYKNGTGEFFKDGDGMKMSKIK